MANASIENRCYCGGEFTLYIDALHHCGTCKRLWLRTDTDSYILMVPWKGFRDSLVFNGDAKATCKRCGGPTVHNTRTLRYKCEDALCAYGWRDTPFEQKSLMEKRLREEFQRLKSEMAEAEDLEPYIVKLSTNKAQMEALRTEEL